MYTSATVKSDYDPGTVETVPFSPTDYPTSVVEQTLLIPPFRKYYEEIHPAQPKISRRKHWNDFEHYKVQSNPSKLPSRAYLWLPTIWGPLTSNQAYIGNPSHPYATYDPGMYGEAGALNNGLLAFYSKRADGGFVPPPADLESLNSRALSAMLPLIKAEMSLINSVLELKDFSSLPRTISNALRLGSSSIGAISSVLRNRSGSLRTFNRPLREWFRLAADAYLQAKFNILPLLSDIAGLRRAISRTEARMNDLITRAGRMQTKHFQLSLQEASSSNYDTEEGGYFNTSVEGYSYGCGITVERFSRLEPSQFHAEIQYNYNYTAYQLEHARILSLLDAVGINFNPAIIWNAIPWSFVVDWVLGVSQWLNKQRIGLMDPQINIHRYLWSIKRRRTISLQQRTVVPKFGYGGPPEFTSPTVQAPVIGESSYRRTTGLPSAGSIISSGLSLKEFSLAAALVIARRSRRIRRTSWGTSYTFPG